MQDRQTSSEMSATEIPLKTKDSSTSKATPRTATTGEESVCSNQVDQQSPSQMGGDSHGHQAQAGETRLPEGKRLYRPDLNNAKFHRAIPRTEHIHICQLQAGYTKLLSLFRG